MIVPSENIPLISSAVIFIVAPLEKPLPTVSVIVVIDPCSITKYIESPAVTPETVNVGVISEVIQSSFLVPLSLASINSILVGLDGGSVIMVIVRGSLTGEEFPAESITRTVIG